MMSLVLLRVSKTFQFLNHPNGINGFVDAANKAADWAKDKVSTYGIRFDLYDLLFVMQKEDFSSDSKRSADAAINKARDAVKSGADSIKSGADKAASKAKKNYVSQSTLFSYNEFFFFNFSKPAQI